MAAAGQHEPENFGSARSSAHSSHDTSTSAAGGESGARSRRGRGRSNRGKSRNPRTEGSVADKSSQNKQTMKEFGALQLNGGHQPPAHHDGGGRSMPSVSSRPADEQRQRQRRRHEGAAAAAGDDYDDSVVGRSLGQARPGRGGSRGKSQRARGRGRSSGAFSESRHRHHPETEHGRSVRQQPLLDERGAHAEERRGGQLDVEAQVFVPHHARAQLVSDASSACSYGQTSNQADFASHTSTGDNYSRAGDAPFDGRSQRNGYQPRGGRGGRQQPKSGRAQWQDANVEQGRAGGGRLGNGRYPHKSESWKSRPPEPGDLPPEDGNAVQDSKQVESDDMSRKHLHGSRSTLNDDGVSDDGEGSDGKARRPPKQQRKVVVQTTGSARADDLIQELISNSCECMVCCDTIRYSHHVWSCDQCFRIFHLRCIQKWGRSEAARVQPSASAAEAELDPVSGWRCPSCRNIHKHIPTAYWCFCGRVDLSKGSQHRRRDYGMTPHSCGEICGKRRPQQHCTHRCNQLCHPGPCPPCPAMLQLACGCGRTTQTVRCSQAGQAPSCQSVCGRTLLCGRHKCTALCHDGPCPVCEEEIQETCYCSRTKRTHPCAQSLASDSVSAGSGGSFGCEELCHRPLACGNHLCEAKCHPGPCKPCALSPEIVTTCHCGQATLAELAKSGVAEARRESCMDPVPSCGQTCNKPHLCGPVEEGNPHRCHLTCHEGPCRPCPSRSVRKCRCGKSTHKLPCKDVLAGKEILCDRLCNAKRSCGRHRCSQRCCTDENHICQLICGKKLRCGQHKCEELCHKGHCDQCWQTIFDELTCHCGAEVLYPPQPCGTQPPPCRRLCSRVHSCEHTPQHCCHMEDECPPCPVLVSKMCMGGHQLRNSVPCHLKDVSCGARCLKPLPCGEHKCDRNCHRGECLEAGQVCKQPCTIPREDCFHPCGVPCHGGERCPDVACRTAVTLHCPCGRRSKQVTCAQATGKTHGLSSLNSTDLARQMASMQAGGSMSFGSNKVEVTCDEECSRQLRINQMAEALRLNTVPMNCALSPFLMEKIKTESSVVMSIDTQVAALVKGVLRMPPGSHKALSLPVMSSEHRHIAHEIAEMYGCESQSFDSEPQRNVRVTAFSHSYPPQVALSDLVQRFRASVPAAATSSTTSSSSAFASKPGVPTGMVVLGKKPPVDHFADP